MAIDLYVLLVGYCVKENTAAILNSVICLPSESGTCQKPSEVDGSSRWIIPLQSHLSAIFTFCQLKPGLATSLAPRFLFLYRSLINCLFAALQAGGQTPDLQRGLVSSASPMRSEGRVGAAALSDGGSRLLQRCKNAVHVRRISSGRHPSG